MPARQYLLIVAACVLLSACRSLSPTQISRSDAGPQPVPARANQWAQAPAATHTPGLAPIVSGFAAQAGQARQTTNEQPGNGPEASQRLVQTVAFHGPGEPEPAALPGPTATGMGQAGMANVMLPTAGPGPCACLTCQSGYAHLPGGAYGGEPGHVLPEDEYIYDGGDRLSQVEISRDWTVRGIDAEDTVAHYDTVDGKTHVAASNRVPIYAPRFAAVRQVTGAVAGEHQSWPIGVAQPEGLVSQERRAGASGVSQPQQIERHLAVVAPYGFRDRNIAMGVEDARFLQGIDFDLMPYENLAAIRDGVYEANEKARLAEAIVAAKTWTLDQNPEVLVDGEAAFESVNAGTLEVAIRYDMPKGKPRLSIVKLASKQNALPGDTLDFTIRFDNVGDQPIGNVTILDRLSPRLSYVADSAKCTVDTDFFEVEQEDGTTLLRWEVKNPLKVSEGGVIHFQCLVR